MAAPEKEREAQKLRFGQWLLNAINSGSYPGLRWIDPARTTFRVPWKHNARKDITSSDLEVFKVGGTSVTSSGVEILKVGGVGVASSSLRLFKAWAKVSRRYEEGSEDPAKWKTNFRCALSSTHMFKLEEDNSKCGDDPHKVFSIVSGSTDSTQLSILEDLLQQCDISPHDLDSLTPSWVPTGNTPHQDTLLQPYADSSQNGCFHPTTFAQWVPTVEQPTLDTYQPTSLMPPEETGVMAPPCHLTEGTVPVQYAAEVALFVPAASPVPQPRLLLDNTDGIVSILDVTIYYRGKEFHREVVGSSRCLLTYQPPSLPESPCPWHVVHFPSPASVPDGKQRRMTEELLGIAGLQLEQRAYKVFATRWEKCRVFWALSQQLEGVEEPPPNLLCRDQETPIFDFNEFCTELRDFRNGQRRRSPDFTIYLCFGQAFSKAKPKESKLILVKLVPKFCEYYYEQVLQEGASSLDSHTISLQLSNSFDLMELIEQYNMQLG
ncbi:hypothetical protein DUI87_22843 [Hirundo rustica rustica]|uniref:IRF tryptophan pentad repeat domain-containing protein n=1 Tax=Hirundo rustica rustica TaxID=333673 RepID=A0A3M0JGH6_HIRRU|nr:hypothetical protein DUI87_22843 [Hirundo rustica rustica]